MVNHNHDSFGPYSLTDALGRTIRFQVTGITVIDATRVGEGGCPFSIRSLAYRLYDPITQNAERDIAESLKEGELFEEN